MRKSINTGLLLVAILLAIGIVCSSSAADNWDEFYQFRHSSTLPGNLFAVTRDGQVGFTGALQQNVPVAYTPCAGNWVIGGNSGSNDGSIHVSWGGAEVNGTAFLGIGLGSPGRGIYFSNMETGDDWCSSYNVQVQVMPETFGHPAVAVGVQDIWNQRQRVVGQPYGARSAYAVITGVVGPEDRPAYISLGWGGGRFGSSPFGGLSMHVADRLAVVAEYDGFNTNAGAAYNFLPSQQKMAAIGYLGWSDLDRPVVGLTFAIH